MTWNRNESFGSGSSVVSRAEGLLILNRDLPRGWARHTLSKTIGHTFIGHGMALRVGIFS
jgi:hypothetical protein